jgi:hypothetical protein
MYWTWKVSHSVRFSPLARDWYEALEGNGVLALAPNVEPLPQPTYTQAVLGCTINQAS